MASVLLGAQRTWSLVRDKDGYRTYKLKYQAKASPLDGPAKVAQTPGIFEPGAPWYIDNDVDDWVFCTRDLNVTPRDETEKNEYWDIEQTFTNKPDESQKCKDQQVDDPLMEPQKVSGGWKQDSREVMYDRFGRFITNSSWEQIRGKEAEYDYGKPTVTIEQNVVDLQLYLLALMVNTVNDAPLWGAPARCVKLADVTWEKKLYGQCYYYYTRKLVYEMDLATWDRDVLDEGYKALNGHWEVATGRWVLDNIAGQPPNPANPAHFIRVTDKEHNPMKVVLDGAGKPFFVADGPSKVAIRVSVATGGQGYAVGDVLTVVGGTAGQTAQIVVLKVKMETLPASHGGATITSIDTVKIQRAGEYTVVPTNPVSVTGGGGTGATFNLVWGNPPPDTSSPGNIHVEYYAEANQLLLGIPTTF